MLIFQDRPATGRASMLEFQHTGKMASRLHDIDVAGQALADGPSITHASMPLVGKIDERFQSYDVEMVEVTGGSFWKPYGGKPNDPPPEHARMAFDLFAYRPPIDLTNARPAAALLDAVVNGDRLSLESGAELPHIHSATADAGIVEFPPATNPFFGYPDC